MRAHCYLILIGDAVVAKRAIGPDLDGSYPAAPPNSELVSFETYKQVHPGWTKNGDVYSPPAEISGRPDTLAERLARLNALIDTAKKILQGVENRVAAAEAKLTQVEGNITMLTNEGTQLRNDVISLKGFRTQATAKFNDVEARLAALEGR